MSRLLLIAFLSTQLIACAGGRNESVPARRTHAATALPQRATLLTALPPHEAAETIAEAFTRMKFRADDPRDLDPDHEVNTYGGDILSGFVRARTSTGKRIAVAARMTSPNAPGRTTGSELMIYSDLPDPELDIVLDWVRRSVDGTHPLQE